MKHSQFDSALSARVIVLIDLIIYPIVKTHKEANDLINVRKRCLCLHSPIFLVWFDGILKCVSMVVVPLVLYQIESIVESIDALICGKGD